MKTPNCLQLTQTRSRRPRYSRDSYADFVPRHPSGAPPPTGPSSPPGPRPQPYASALEEKSAYHLYLREIGQIPLLTPEEETQLALRVQQGDDEARERMIQANLRLVVKIARDYEGMGVPLLDLVNEGNIGLMKAVERFDPDRGAKLSTYGALWIKQAIKRALANQGRDIRLPVHVHDKLGSIQSCILRHHAAHGRAPSPEEIGKEVGLPPHKVLRLMESSKRPASLDAKVGESEGSVEFGNAIADERAADPFECLALDNALGLMNRFIQCLKPRELQILDWRFGLSGGPSETLEEIGQRLNLTREAVRQIQNRALLKLRTQFRRADKKPISMALGNEAKG